jgi:hypothetical protein
LVEAGEDGVFATPRTWAFSDLNQYCFGTAMQTGAVGLLFKSAMENLKVCSTFNRR